MRPLLVFALLVASLATSAAAQTLTGEGETPGQSVQIRDLRRDAAGNVTLRFVLVNDSPNGVSGVMLRAEGDEGYKPSGVKLVDDASGQEITPLRSADGSCVCVETPNTGRGERANLWVKFADVPPEWKAASVAVPTFEPVSGVPIQGPAPPTLTGGSATPGSTIQIRELKRDATGAVTLRLTLVNNSCCGISSVMLREKDSDQTPSDVKLIDETTGEEYRPARTPAGECACSGMPNTGRGERANIWMRFTDIPPTLKKATVELRTFEQIAGVAITGP
ncbi:MAG: hypothetical protein Q8S13_02090 [Dehalococcoidia bacterium]|nr:hypothetical protein [Dehalococcoidia bacterium]